MQSQAAQALSLTHDPVAVLLSDQEPESALRFKKGRFGCVMFMFANAAKGKTAAFDAETYGCWGGGVGLGFGNAYLDFPGGVECFCHFLSSGNTASEKGKQVAAAMEGKARAEFIDDYLQGERYRETPALVGQWIDELPIMDVDAKYVVFKPLSQVDLETEQPETVVFLADADQISALVVLANYARPGRDNVTIPWAAGCQQIGLLPFQEAKSDNPRAVVGLTDPSARKNVRKLLGDKYLTFAMPWKLFLEMEGNVQGSFLQRPTWLSLAKQDGE